MSSVDYINLLSILASYECFLLKLNTLKITIKLWVSFFLIFIRTSICVFYIAYSDDDARSSHFSFTWLVQSIFEWSICINLLIKMPQVFSFIFTSSPEFNKQEGSHFIHSFNCWLLSWVYYTVSWYTIRSDMVCWLLGR